MGKKSAPRPVAENEARAVARVLRTSPRKLNLLAKQIRGMGVQKALNELSFSNRRMAADVKKVLQSAVANAENNHSSTSTGSSWPKRRSAGRSRCGASRRGRAVACPTFRNIGAT